MRTFETGATRNNDEGRIDPEGFISPSAMLRFCEYMQANRKQADGTYRASDNWQKGIPDDSYMKSMTRHFYEVWLLHRDGSRAQSGHLTADELNKTKQDALCALLFNVQGMLHELLKQEAIEKADCLNSEEHY